MSSAAIRHLDRRELPRYTVAEVANYLKLPESTVRVWFFGQANFDRIFLPASNDKKLLSFFNIVEAHSLSWTKRRYPQIRVPRIRAALEFVRDTFPQYEHPLITKKFSTEGKYLFLKQLDMEPEGEVPTPPINASQWGQLALPIVSEYLELIEYDDRDLAKLLYPHEGQRIVVINPVLSSGRPVIKGTGVLASIIWQRAKKAREPIDRLARDYKLDPSEVKAAIDYFEAA